MSTSTPYRAASAALAVSALLLVAGCSSGGTTTPGATSGDDATDTGSGDTRPSGLIEDCSDLDALYAAAKAEGTLVRWGGQDPADMQQIYAAFNEKYPGITITDAVVNPDEVPTRLLTEKSAGNPPPDLFQGRVNFLQPLLDADALDEEVPWAQCGARDSIIQQDGGLTENIQPWVLAYNTDKVDPADLPTTWDELDDPALAGTMSIDPRGFPFDLLVLDSDEQSVVDLVTGIKNDVNPTITQGGTAGLTQLASGEVSIRPALLPDVRQNQDKGAPIDFTYLDPVPVQNDGVYMPAGIEHPNAAMLFALWYTAEDGGQAITRDINFRDNSEPSDLPDGATLIQAETPEDATAVSEANAKVVAVWTGQ